MKNHHDVKDGQNSQNENTHNVTKSPSTNHSPSENNQQTTKKIWGTIFLLYTITLSDGIATELIVPLLPELCKSRFGLQETETGTAVGLLNGSRDLANFFSSFFIGHLSDHFGRKLLVVVALFSLTVTTFLIAILPTFWLAFLTRAISGFTNGNTSLLKAAISDLTTGPTRALAFAYHGATYQLSRALANAIGGATAGIRFSSSIAIFDNNQFLLPCVLGAGATFVVMIISIFSFPETLRKETTPDQQQNDNTSNSLISSRDSLSQSASKSKKLNVWQSLIEGLKLVWRDNRLRKLFAAFCLNGFCNGGIIIGIIMFLSLDREYHGLGFTTREVGFAFLCFGFAAFLFQVIFFKMILMKIGLYRAYIWGNSICVITSISFPITGFIFWIGGFQSLTQIFTWGSLVIELTGFSIGFMLGLSVLGVMISNAADPERQGLTQGACGSVASLVRSFGPIVSGAIFDLGTRWRFPFLLFCFLALLYFICNVILRKFSPEDIEICEGTRKPLSSENENSIELSITVNENNHQNENEENDKKSS